MKEIVICFLLLIVFGIVSYKLGIKPEPARIGITSDGQAVIVY